MRKSRGDLCRRLSSAIRQLSSGWIVLVSVAVFILFSALVLPKQAARAESYAAEAGSLDTSFWYSTEDIYRVAEAYGEEGRRLYVTSRLTFDVAWPLVYALFLTTTTSWVYAKTFAPGSRGQLTNLTPLLAACFDYLENASTSLVMLRYPHRTPVVDLLAPAFTVTKWILISASFAFLLVGMAVGLWRAVRRRTA